MKKSSEIAGLPIISINDGVEIGMVQSLILNPEKGSIDFLTIQHEEWDENIKTIPFKKVVGIGEYALTVENANSVIDLNEVPVVNQLVSRNIKINSNRVMSRKGQLLGQAVEFYTDEENGQVIGIVIEAGNRERLLPSEHVLTYGKDIIIVKDDAASLLVDRPENLLDSGVPAQEEEVEETESGAMDALRLKQIELLTGRKTTKEIHRGNGSILFPAGIVLEKEDVMKAQTEGPGVIVELSMNVEG